MYRKLLQWYRSSEFRNESLIYNLINHLITNNAILLHTLQLTPYLWQLSCLEIREHLMKQKSFESYKNGLKSVYWKVTPLLDVLRLHYHQRIKQNNLLTSHQRLHNVHIRTSINKTCSIVKASSVSWHLFVAFYSANVFSQNKDSNLIHFSNLHNIKFVAATSQTGFSYVLNFATLKRQWIIGFELMLNLYYAKKNLFCFGRHELRFQILSLNWKDWPFAFTAWRSSASFFYLRPSRSSISSRIFFRALVRRDPLFFIFDCHYHTITIDYLIKNKAMLIAALTLSFDNWKITYVLPIIITNFFSHYFIFLFLLEAKRTAIQIQYEKSNAILSQLYQISLVRTLKHITDNSTIH